MLLLLCGAAAAAVKANLAPKVVVDDAAAAVRPMVDTIRRCHTEGEYRIRTKHLTIGNQKTPKYRRKIVSPNLIQESNEFLSKHVEEVMDVT